MESWLVMKKNILLISLLLAACPPTAAVVDEASVISVQYSPATRPWLADLEACAADGGSILLPETRAAGLFDPEADLALRLGEPGDLATTAYQVGSEAIQVVANSQGPLENLTQEEVRAIFQGQVQDWSELGGASLPVQVWVYSPGEDIQQAFTAAIMQGMPVSSLSRLATSPEAMAAAVAADPAAIGFLSARMVEAVEGLQVVFTSAAFPILAFVDPEQERALRLVTCLQNRNP